jgi:hypothetical protein
VGALNKADSDEGANSVVRAFLLLKVEAWRSALFASKDDLEEMRCAQFAAQVANEEYHVASLLEELRGDVL